MGGVLPPLQRRVLEIVWSLQGVRSSIAASWSPRAGVVPDVTLVDNLSSLFARSSHVARFFDA